MKYLNNNFYVITGGPGVGKTTLLKQLEKEGYRTIEEDARQIIKDQMHNQGEGLPWKDKELYTHLMINASVNSFKAISNDQKNIVFFDRGIVDAFCYADMIALKISADMKNIVDTYRYNPKVFILPPWAKIYETDNERKQTWEEAVDTYDAMKATYSTYGYKAIEVPLDTVENRVKFILNHID
ncbi:AAA family ATPase [Chryseobacterium paridis]|uniref:AAA family ATPase n=1 Tax=Chryseobacterium paridis TaxID=2800328 RepID=A0ABS1FVF7_9FLAO|nr:AAA family ATPase [Chryseobacterium paridis]MBK1896417.1 AAA family ATPase [Chryseobacterium paridis]